MTADAPRPFPKLPDHIHRIHIIGICGTAMGSLAAMLKTRGFDVRGSDAMAYPPMSDWLAERDIDIMLGYKAENLDWNPDLVVVGNVSRATYADAVETRRRNIPYLSLPETLRHFFMSETRNMVLTGTHGKTTTTSLLSWLMHEANKDPGFMVGGITGNFGSNFRLGQGDVFVIEGDEYDTAYFDKVPKFWHYAPHRATINNIEYDHADIYPDIEAIEHVFRRFVDLIPEDGSLWVNGDDERAMAVSAHCKGKRSTFGFGEQNDLRASEIQHGKMTSALVHLHGQALGRFELNAIGDFNIRNMLGALGMALDEGLDVELCRQAFKTFKSVKKRQEFIGEVSDILIYDDFAHHPSAVEATLRAMRNQFPNRKIWAAFETKSNTSRRRVFQDLYPPALAQADEVILSKPWRKDEGLPPEQLMNIDEMRQTIESLGAPTQLIPSVDDIVSYLVEHVQPGDVIVGLSGSSFGGFHRKCLAALEAKFAKDA